ncbi:DUF2254 domain-containing protein [Actinotalea sp. K2]|uniref:DUF2254 domain-containing protein n=1 Tax=Actinotalea sp. K2 TaxID=2939438 RepID=UPI0020178D51|nr:DUF2254 domain-containing protein [Actinotalea sp. K2]MCL3862904.1 DUF2254 domain-containing protein [Actinotalea sp. K2]
MNLLQRVSERFWFIPAVLCVGAFVLAEVLVAVDQRIVGAAIPAWAEIVLYRVGESGSRDVLGAIASSSLAVAGTTFSITMAVLALTSSSYGPRLVRNFMADRGNQAVLGVYVATFLYSLLVLRAIRVPGDPGDQEAEVFVPHLAVNAAVVFAVVNVGVLIYFIHHISDSIQIWTLAAGVRGDLHAAVERLYPADVGRSRPPGDAHGSRDGLPDHVAREGVAVHADGPGYLQYVEDERLMSVARKNDLVLALQVRPGQYVLEDTAVVLVHPPGRADDQVRAALGRCFVVGDARSPYQDVEFAVQQLTEMAVRALSPGTNDPYTAQNALDDLSTGLAVLAQRKVPAPERYDEDGALRVHAPRVELESLLDQVLDSMRWYAVGAPSVMHATLELVRRTGEHARSVSVRTHLVGHVRLLRSAFAAAGHHRHDVDRFEAHADRVVALVTQPA